MQTTVISIPEITAEGISYKITVKPKIAVVGAENEDEDIIELASESVLAGSEQKLPSTGVLNWPIVVLTITGVSSFCISLIVFYYKKNKISIALMGIAFVMIIVALQMQINNEISNINHNREALEVVTQIEEILDNYQVDEDEEGIKKLNIDGIAYIGILFIPELDNMALRSS